jgi:L-fuculose-phosphate aldolase
MDYSETDEADVVILRNDGSTAEGKRKPTSEKDLHLAIYNVRPDVNAVVHVHSVFATTLATLGWEIPPISYLVAMSGSKVPIAPYRTFGTQELAETVSSSLEKYNAVLMENHGMVTVGADIRSAFNRAETMEFVAQIYWRARSLGDPGVLSEKEMHNVMEKFQTYGQ